MSIFPARIHKVNVKYDVLENRLGKIMRPHILHIAVDDKFKKYSGSCSK